MGDGQQSATAPAVDIPYDAVNEQIIIAAALTDDRARDVLVQKIQPDIFLDPQHASIWTALKRMRLRKYEWSLQTLHQQVSGRVELDYLKSLMETYPTAPVNLEHHITALRWDHTRAESVRGPLTDLLTALRDPTTPPERVRALGRSIAQCYEAHVDRQFMRDPALLAKEHAAEIAKRASQAVYPFGVEGLDRFEDGIHRLIPGAAPTKTTLITGVSGSGKSIFAAKIGLEQARRRRRVLYGAWEMDAGPTIELMAMMSLGLSRYKVSTGMVSPDELAEIEERMTSIGSYVRFFDPPFSYDPSKRYGNNEALDVLHRCIADSGAEVVILDLWERIIPDGGPEPERRALWRQQQIAIETQTHCILVCQQRLKEVEKRPDKRPSRDTILGSSAWVDIADTILGVHRPALWKAMDDNTLEVLVLKQRFGRWPLAVEFDWDGDACLLKNGRTIDYESPGAERSDFGKFSRRAAY